MKINLAKLSKRAWIMNVGYIVFASACSALDIFHNIHPFWRAMRFWYPVPWVGFLAYLFGRMDQRRAYQQRELDNLDKEIQKIMDEHVALMRMKTRLYFKNDRPN